MARDNDAAEFVIEEMRRLADGGGASLQENPENSLHWATPMEVSRGSWTASGAGVVTLASLRRSARG